MTHPTQSSLLKDRRFGPLFWTQFLGAFNDNFFKNALVILITFQGIHVFGLPPAQMVAASGGIFILPYFLFSATAGQLADLKEKSSLIRHIKLAEVVIMLIAALGLLLGWHGFLFLVLFALGLQSTFFGPLKFSILPQHLKPAELVGGNALIEAGTFLAILLGTLLGGNLIAVSGYGPAIVAVGGVIFALAGWAVSFRIPTAPAADPGLKFQWNPIPPTVDIIRFAHRTRSVWLSILGISWFWFFGSAVLSVFPSWCRDELGGDASVVTLFLALFSVGIAAGSLLCEKFSRRQLELGLVPFGAIGISVFLAWLATTSSPLAHPTFAPMSALELLKTPEGLLVCTKLLLLSVWSGFYVVPLYTLMQERSDPGQRSRIIAANNVLNACFMVVAAVLLVGLRALDLSTPAIFLVLAGLNLLTAIYIFTLLPEFLMRFNSWILANLIYRLKITGHERVPVTGALVIIANHVSFIDWLLVSALSPRPVRFVMDHQFAKGFFASRFSRMAKIIPIAPAKENPATLEQAFRLIAEELRAGEVVCIFPEGKITKDGKLNEFRPGIERILAETPTAVLPVAIRGMWGSFFSRSDGPAMQKVPRRFWSRVELRVGSVTPASASSPPSVEALREQVASLLK